MELRVRLRIDPPDTEAEIEFHLCENAPLRIHTEELIASALLHRLDRAQLPVKAVTVELTIVDEPERVEEDSLDES